MHSGASRIIGGRQRPATRLAATMLLLAALPALASCGGGSGVSTLQASSPASFAAALAGFGESACPQGTPAEHVALFAPLAAFVRERLTRNQRATVRITVRPESELRPLLAQLLQGQRYDLGIFNSFREAGQGLCTGTLIDSSLVLTAGHCVSPAYWYTEQYERLGQPPPPVVVDESDQFVRYFTSAELAVLLQADFNHERVYVADASGKISPSRAADPFTLPFKELISGQYDDPSQPSGRDYAILRVDRGNRDLSPYSLGLARLRYGPLSAGRPLAIVQHPGGGEKKIAAGTLRTVRSGRLEYANINTDGGSSGAGIFLPDGGITGIHTRGGCGITEQGGANKGVELRRIRATIEGLRQPD